MKRRAKVTWQLLKNTYKKWNDRGPFRESSIIAYNAIFSLPGLLVVIVTLTGYFFGAEFVNGHLHYQISKAMGEETADQIETMIIAAYRNTDSFWATILGLATIFIGATGVFVQLQTSLNNIWEVKVKIRKPGIWTYLKSRLFSFGLILSIAFLLLISLVISSLLSVFGDWLTARWSDSSVIILYMLNFIVSMLMITVLFAMMFKILPDAKIKWRSVWAGALFTSLLFVIGKTALGLYFGKASPGSGYGAAGSVVLILLWASYSSMIVFFGAEFTKVYSDHYFGETPANELAVKVDPEKTTH